MSPNAVSNWIKRLGKRAKLTDVHTGKLITVTLTLLRATGMSLADMDDVARQTTALQAGHENTRVMERHYLDTIDGGESLKAYSAVYDRLWKARADRE